MGEEKVTTPKTSKKISYDDLKVAASQWMQRAQIAESKNRQLIEQITALNMSNSFQVVEFMFKVLSCSNQFHSDFVIRCAEEIEANVTSILDSKTTANGGEEEGTQAGRD